MTIQSEIDETLRRLGSAEPPLGLERRVNLRLQLPRPRFSTTRIYAACALAASIALSAVALNPALRSLMFHPHSTPEHAGGRRTTSGCPGGGRVWDCFGGSRSGAAGSRAAHAS